MDLKMKKLTELAGQCQPSHSEQVWKSDQMVTMEDLIKFDEPIDKPVKTTLDINLAVKALQDIQASNGERMFGLLDQFLSSHQIGTLNLILT